MMKRLLAAATFLVAGVSTAATAPFVQISGAPQLANTCARGATVPMLPVSIEVPAGASYGYDVSYVVPGYYINDYYGPIYIEAMNALLFTGATRPGPVVDSNVAFDLAPVNSWFGALASVPEHTEMSLTVRAYSGPGGGAVASTSTLNWDCTTGAIVSSANTGNAQGAVPATLTKGAAVEFYNSSLGHYFISADLTEIGNLDSGKTVGWTRTGYAFNVFNALATASSPVCRFYIPPDRGNSHFYSASPGECDEVHTKFPALVYESTAVFYVDLPDALTGACPALTVPVYRLWNNRADSNHRYTTDPAIKQQMIDAGYIAEGYGPNLVIMCAPM